MRLLLLPTILIIILSAGIDTYIYMALKRRCKSALPARIQKISAIALLVIIVATIALPRRSGSESMLLTIMWLLFGYVSIYLPKLIFTIIDLLARIPQIFGRKRLKAVSIAGAIAAAATFVLLWWSALVTRNSIQVKELEVDIPGLPEQFDGYRIVQFSDAHTGTYGADTAFVARTVERINSLRPDLIVFTGDIVNMRSDELTPHCGPLSRLSAPDGVMSILGNHDYGDYSHWPSDSAKRANMQLLIDLQRRMGWKLLLDETRMIRRGTDSIAIIGVENIGDPPFPTYGSLARAYATPADSVTKILLSHNPMHWSDSIAGNPDMNIALTLAGHTHAMQCEIAGMSPASLRYPLWGGLYSSRDSLRRLYVNIGLGAVGMPVRIGQAKPEITVITLRRN